MIIFRENITGTDSNLRTRSNREREISSFLPAKIFPFSVKKYQLTALTSPSSHKLLKIFYKYILT